MPRMLTHGWLHTFLLWFMAFLGLRTSKALPPRRVMQDYRQLLPFCHQGDDKMEQQLRRTNRWMRALSLLSACTSSYHWYPARSASPTTKIPRHLCDWQKCIQLYLYQQIPCHFPNDIKRSRWRFWNLFLHCGIDVGPIVMFSSHLVAQCFNSTWSLSVTRM